MTVSPINPPFKTKSGKPITIGTGSGSVWKDRKRANPEDKDIPQRIIDTIASSLESGFNHIDTADAYNTFGEVKQAIKASGKHREDIWITSKYGGGTGKFTPNLISPTDSIDKALREIGTDYLDLFLLHHPFFQPEYSHGQTIESAWKELEVAKKAGKVREIGVSNFRVEDLERIAKFSTFSPVVNQIEFHPYLQDQSPGIVEYSQSNGILLEAYAPLTPIFRIVDAETKESIDHPLQKVLEEFAAKYDRTPAQVILRYTLQKGVLPITTSQNKQRQKESIGVYDFELEDSDVRLISEKGNTFPYRTCFIGLF